MEDDRLISLQEAAAEIGRSRMTLLRHIRAGDLQARKVGPIYVIRASDWESFKANRKPPGRPPKQPPRDDAN